MTDGVDFSYVMDLDTERENKLGRLQQEDACGIKVFSSWLETSGLVVFWQE